MPTLDLDYLLIIRNWEIIHRVLEKTVHTRFPGDGRLGFSMSGTLTGAFHV